ncbi:MAG TPA: cytochrome c [Acidobacteriaceae bacterium]|jgi:mono/diheme cytochrome c family protein
MQLFLGLAFAGLLLILFPFAIPPRSVQAYADHKAEGAELFESSGCAHCHGNLAQGSEKGPALRTVRNKMTAERMHKQIMDGGDSMPAFGDALKEDQVQALIELLRTKHPEKLLAHVKTDKAEKPAAQ